MPVNTKYETLEYKGMRAASRTGKTGDLRTSSLGEIKAGLSQYLITFSPSANSILVYGWNLKNKRNLDSEH